ncbi:uncharacterized protein FIBRA_07955 [Fibroporia radiculosa]|uniref:Inhibitor I9 domain-containing protein n=1 Tax=Fibroporia radiculosa TaxID=599839 RepID=J4GG12_9APHY|nr:uncharacterized protein FIBRA_07955 [Fibroporia radiculosa]CCM05723.1 predicted protein [Fibroporia radiculosa]
MDLDLPSAILDPFKPVSEILELAVESPPTREQKIQSRSTLISVGNVNVMDRKYKKTKAAISAIFTRPDLGLLRPPNMGARGIEPHRGFSGVLLNGGGPVLNTARAAVGVALVARSLYIRLPPLEIHQSPATSFAILSRNSTAMSGKYIVVFKDHVTADQVANYARDVDNNGGHVSQSFEPLLKGFSATLPEEYFNRFQSLQGDVVDYIGM